MEDLFNMGFLKTFAQNRKINITYNVNSMFCGPFYELPAKRPIDHPDSEQQFVDYFVGFESIILSAVEKSVTAIHAVLFSVTRTVSTVVVFLI